MASLKSLHTEVKKMLKQVEEQKKQEEVIHVIFHADHAYTINYLDEFGKPQTNKYLPEPTPLKVHEDKTNFVRAMKGPYGSGKTVACISDLLLCFKDMPACKDGIRRCRDGVFRTTYNQLESGTIPSFLAWFGQLGYAAERNQLFVKKPFPIFNSRFKAYDEVKNEYFWCNWEVFFMAFESSEDGEKLGSTEFTKIYLNEAKDFPHLVFDKAGGRVNRYPGKKDFGVPEEAEKPYYFNGLLLDTNPPDNDHWFYETFEQVKPAKHIIYNQPPGVFKDANYPGGYRPNFEAENLRNLGRDYYINYIQGKSEQFIRIYAMGEYGTTAEGQKVFEEYNDDLHSVDNLTFREGYPLYLAWDFGLTPCLLVCQYIDGQLLALKEFVGEACGIENLINQQIRPWWSLNNMERFQIAVSVADPSGNNKRDDDVFRPTLIGILNQQFCPTQPAHTNDPHLRLETFRPFLNSMAKGKPAFVLSRQNCDILRKGFNGKYLLKRVMRGSSHTAIYDKIPDKTHPYSEPQDCLQYIAVAISRAANYNAAVSKVPARRPVDLYGQKPIILGA